MMRTRESRLPTVQRDGLSTGTSQEYSIFNSVQYHREIRKIRQKSIINSAEEQDRPFKIDMLPPLHKAAATGDLFELHRLVASGTDINDPLPYKASHKSFQFKGCSPLLAACWFGRATSIIKLIKLGAEINSCDFDGAGVLHYACYSDNPERIIPLLLKNGADTRVRDRYGATTFHEACRLGLAWSIQLFLDRGAVIEDRNVKGFTALQISALKSRPLVFDILLDQGAIIKVSNNIVGFTTLHCAVYGGSLEIVETILKATGAADINTVTSANRPPLHIAAILGHHSLIELLIQFGADLKSKKGVYESSALHWASRYGHTQVVAELLRQGADIDMAQEFEWTALHIACYWGHIEVAKKLLEYGAKSLADGDGMLPLYVASYRGRAAILELLLHHGEDPNKIRNTGETALGIAVYNGHSKIISLLINAGAELHSREKWGNTPLHIAAFGKNLDAFKLLMDAGSSATIANDAGYTALDLLERRFGPIDKHFPVRRVG